MKLFRGKRKRKILFLVLFLACVGFGFWSIFMDSSDSINVITQLQQQNIDKKTETDPKVSVQKVEKEKEGVEGFLKKANEQAKEVIKDVKKKINTTNDSEEEEGSIFDWWWTLVGAYFLFKLFLGD